MNCLESICQEKEFNDWNSLDPVKVLPKGKKRSANTEEQFYYRSNKALTFTSLESKTNLTASSALQVVCAETPPPGAVFTMTLDVVTEEGRMSFDCNYIDGQNGNFMNVYSIVALREDVNSVFSRVFPGKTPQECVIKKFKEQDRHGGRKICASRQIQLIKQQYQSIRENFTEYNLCADTVFGTNEDGVPLMLQERVAVIDKEQMEKYARGASSKVMAMVKKIFQFSYLTHRVDGGIDLKWDNLGWKNDRLVLIDFGGNSNDPFHELAKETLCNNLFPFSGSKKLRKSMLDGLEEGCRGNKESGIKDLTRALQELRRQI